MGLAPRIFIIYVVIIPMYFVIAGTQLAFSNAFSAGMAKITIAAGFASALFASIQMGGSAIANTIASALHVRNQIPLAVILVVLCLVFFVIAYFGIQRKEVAEH